ncbi:MAG: F0F1 ATP synthase subunit A [Alphaproteobacteria bacterium]|nr:MAG: F0F1 ATP synthase subunit A [Alphaproteobacteria bacterium]TAF76529.1 MAG: F0F1 ATP synthase subunit A [Alphaproteobacteria bacterium]
MAEVHSPLEQFTIKTLIQLPELGGYAIHFTNSSFWMVISVLVCYALFMVGLRRASIVPTRMQSMVEITYQFMSDTLRENAGEAGRPYFPFIFSVFLFVLFCNLMGIIPYSFTATSHLAVTFTLALLVFVICTIIGFVKGGSHFLEHFWMPDVPLVLRPVVCVLEVCSYFVRPVSLSLRLAATMMSGHLIMKLFASFVIMMGFFGILPFAFLVGFTVFEVFIAILHAYIFSLLSCVYLNDALGGAH